MNILIIIVVAIIAFLLGALTQYSVGNNNEDKNKNKDIYLEVGDISSKNGWAIACTANESKIDKDKKNVILNNGAKFRTDNYNFNCN
jgi:NADH:ubiquinone oxidoreductase subunit 3 (subunit A)